MLRVSSRLVRASSRISFCSISPLVKLGAHTKLLAPPTPAPPRPSSASSSEDAKAAAGALLASLALGAVGAALGLHIVHADGPSASGSARPPPPPPPLPPQQQTSPARA